MMPSMRLHWSFLAASALLAPGILADTCYQVGYGLVAKTSWSACNNTSPSTNGVRICCNAGDTCSQDGLCRGISGGTDILYYNAGCTDSSYTDPICRKTCIAYMAIYTQYNSSSGRWACCGSKSCDGSPTNVTFNAVSPQDFPLLPSTTLAISSSTSTSSSSTSSTSSTSSSASTTASSSTNTPSASNASNPSTGLSTGAQAGIGVGVAVGALLLIGMGIVLYMRKRRQNKEQAEVVSHKFVEEKPPGYTFPAEMDGHRPSEVDGMVAHELSGADHRR